MAEKLENLEDEPGAQERFDRALRRALATPPKPHKDKGDSKPSPKPHGLKRPESGR
jgi:hypothetical protein